MNTAKRMVLVAILGFLLSSLSVFAGESSSSEESKNPGGIIGKTFDFDYGESAYSISIKTDSELHWELTKGEYPGPQKGDEKYYVSKVSDGIVFISWVENSGLGLYNIMNFNTHELITHAREKGVTYINKGTLKEIK